MIMSNEKQEILANNLEDKEKSLAENTKLLVNYQLEARKAKSISIFNGH